MLSALLKINGVDGESQDSKYPKWIEITGWSFGETQAGAGAYGSGTGTGKVSMEDFRFNKLFDASSTKVFELCSSGQHIPDARLLVRRSGADSGELEDYLQIDFEDLIISSYQTSGSSGDSGLPSESISFNFASHKTTYFIQQDGKNAGTMMTGYNVKTGVAI